MSEDDQGFAPPEGFVRLDPTGPYTIHNGPLYGLKGAEAKVQALHLLPRHANRFGVIHGGMMAGFLDTLLGMAAAEAAAAAVVTLNLSVDYLAMARVGDWLVGRATVTRVTRHVVFAEARTEVDGRQVSRGSGVFKVMGKRG